MTRDQFICEMMGKCWHEWGVKDRAIVCSKCGVWGSTKVHNPVYSKNPADILELQQFVMGAEWWGEFYWWAVNHDRSWIITPEPSSAAFAKWLFSSPDRFATLVAEYRGYKGKGE